MIFEHKEEIKCGLATSRNEYELRFALRAFTRGLAPKAKTK